MLRRIVVALLLAAALSGCMDETPATEPVDGAAPDAVPPAPTPRGQDAAPPAQDAPQDVVLEPVVVYSLQARFTGAGAFDQRFEAPAGHFVIRSTNWAQEGPCAGVVVVVLTDPEGNVERSQDECDPSGTAGLGSIRRAVDRPGGVYHVSFVFSGTIAVQFAVTVAPDEPFAPVVADHLFRLEGGFKGAGMIEQSFQAPEGRLNVGAVVWPKDGPCVGAGVLIVSNPSGDVVREVMECEVGYGSAGLPGGGTWQAGRYDVRLALAGDVDVLVQVAGPAS